MHRADGARRQQIAQHRILAVAEQRLGQREGAAPVVKAAPENNRGVAVQQRGDTVHKVRRKIGPQKAHHQVFFTRVVRTPVRQPLEFGKHLGARPAGIPGQQRQQARQHLGRRHHRRRRWRRRRAQHNTHRLQQRAVRMHNAKQQVERGLVDRPDAADGDMRRRRRRHQFHHDAVVQRRIVQPGLGVGRAVGAYQAQHIVPGGADFQQRNAGVERLAGNALDNRLAQFQRVQRRAQQQQRQREAFHAQCPAARCSRSRCSAICTLLVAAPLRKLSLTTHKSSPRGCEMSLRRRPTKTSSLPSASVAAVG